MTRKRRWFSILIPLPLVLACAMLRDGNPATTPKTGPGTDYPCGVGGILCPDHTCCAKGGECVEDDGGPYCQYVNPDDFSDPTMLRRRTRGPRTSPH